MLSKVGYAHLLPRQPSLVASREAVLALDGQRSGCISIPLG